MTALPDPRTADVTSSFDKDGYCRIAVAAVRRETEDAVSVILDIPDHLQGEFTYTAGQFLTLRIAVEGQCLVRSYSMSSSPDTDEEFRITVKRIPEGRVSSRIVESLRPGDTIDVMRPAGRFCLRSGHGSLVLFAGGSGITPILSIIKTALAKTDEHVTLVYANRDCSTSIFAHELDALAEAYKDRFRFIQWFDADRGFLDRDAINSMQVIDTKADFYVCGPAVFMDVTEAAVLAAGIDPEHVFIERFVSPPDPDEVLEATATETDDSAICERVTVRLRGTTTEMSYTAGDTIIETLRRVGIRPPFSCLLGTCGTCIAKVTKGSVAMRNNEVLHQSEIEQGYVLTCQGRPTSKEVKLIYED